MVRITLEDKIWYEKKLLEEIPKGKYSLGRSNRTYFRQSSYNVFIDDITHTEQK